MCPIRTLAMTGIVTASTISLIILGSLCNVCMSSERCSTIRASTHHTSYTAIRTNVSGDTFQCHYGTSPCFFSYTSLAWGKILS